MAGNQVTVDVDPVLRASKVISAAIALSLEGADVHLSLPQLRALAVIDARGPANLSAVAEGLGVNASNASRACDRLVRNGLLDRREDPHDRRSVVLTLTRDGRRLLDGIMKKRHTVLMQVMGRMSAADQARMSEAMRAFTEAADELTRDGELLSDGDGHLLRWLG
jgi:DNA-binding MarR family transcriptional regulator